MLHLRFSATPPHRKFIVLLMLSVIALVVYTQSDTLHSLFHAIYSSGKPAVPLPTSRRPFRPTPLPIAFQHTTATSKQQTVVQPLEQCTVTTRTGRAAYNGRWYNYSTRGFQLYAYTALLDDRPSLHSPPLVRIIAISSKLEDATAHNVSISLYCRLHYEATITTHTVRMAAEPKPIGFGWPLNGETAKEYIYSCPLDNTTMSAGLPIAVAILRSQLEVPDQTVSSCLPIELPVKPAATPGTDQNISVAICAPVAFNRVPAVKLIEWLELQRLLGVSLVGVYSMHLDNVALAILQRYASRGFVDLRFTDYIADGHEQHWLHSTPVVNDCIYRHMYQFTHIAVLDLDELIVPDNFTSLHDLLRAVQRATAARQPVNFVFRNSYFFTDIPTNSSANLTLIKHNYKVALSPPGYSVKSIINPLACTHMHNHYCWGRTAGYQSRPGDDEVNPLIATNRHYKKCHFNEHECKQMMSHVTRDDVMQHFAGQLEERVNRIINTDFPFLVNNKATKT